MQPFETSCCGKEFTSTGIERKVLKPHRRIKLTSKFLTIKPAIAKSEENVTLKLRMVDGCEHCSPAGFHDGWHGRCSWAACIFGRILTKALCLGKGMLAMGILEEVQISKHQGGLFKISGMMRILQDRKASITWRETTSRQANSRMPCPEDSWDIRIHERSAYVLTGASQTVLEGFCCRLIQSLKIMRSENWIFSSHI